LDFYRVYFQENVCVRESVCIWEERVCTEERVCERGGVGGRLGWPGAVVVGSPRRRGEWKKWRKKEREGVGKNEN